MGRGPERRGQDRTSRLREGLVRYMAAYENQELLAAVEAFPELLSDQGERVAAQTAAQLRGQMDSADADDMDAKVELLRRARVVGMERALFDEMMSPFNDHVDAAEAALNGFLSTGDGDLLVEAVTVWRAIVRHEYLPYNGVEYEHWALGRAAMAMVLHFRRSRDRATLDEAVLLLERAAALEDVSPQRRVEGLLDLGEALMLRHHARDSRADRHRAIAVLRSAEAMTRPGSPARRKVTEAISAAQEGTLTR
jgi:hypothetical protein